MRSAKLFPGVMLILLMVCCAFARQTNSPDVTGTWELTVETPQGTGNPSIVLKQDGEKITGVYKGRFGEVNLEGTIKGNDITFSITVNAQGTELTITYRGKVEQDSMSGSVDFGGFAEGTWTGKRKKEG
jgi:hypothetical protein